MLAARSSKVAATQRPQLQRAPGVARRQVTCRADAAPFLGSPTNIIVSGRSLAVHAHARTHGGGGGAVGRAVGAVGGGGPPLRLACSRVWACGRACGERGPPVWPWRRCQQSCVGGGGGVGQHAGIGGHVVPRRSNFSSLPVCGRWQWCRRQLQPPPPVGSQSHWCAAALENLHSHAISARLRLARGHPCPQRVRQCCVRTQVRPPICGLPPPSRSAHARTHAQNTTYCVCGCSHTRAQHTEGSPTTQKKPPTPTLLPADGGLHRQHPVCRALWARPLGE